MARTKRAEKPAEKIERSSLSRGERVRLHNLEKAISKIEEEMSFLDSGESLFHQLDCELETLNILRSRLLEKECR
jgi:predicted transcriptional regulator